MFKSARWRSDKNKIKAVFKLQFHATQLTQIGGDSLTIAVIPGDTGKPAARLEKAKVKNGNCYWEKPHYETIKFTQDQKTGKINEKIYRFVVATGSSIFGVVGEVSVDFSSYAEATKLSSLSLPLKYAKSASLLHVSIQRVQDQRDIDESENMNEEYKNLNLEESIRSDPDPSEDHEGLIDNIKRDRGTSSGSDITLSCSDNLSTDDSSIREIPEEGSPDDVIKKLKGEIVILARQAEVSEMELQTLRKHVVKESKKSQDLSREVAALKEERKECEKVKVKVNGRLLTEGGDTWRLVDELRQELNYEKDLNSNIRLQLQKTQESNAELILAVRDLDEMLESKSKCCVSPKLEEVKIIDLYNEIELYKRDKDEIEMQMEQIALDYEILKQENHDISYKLEQSQLQEELKMQYECSTLESHIENIEIELKTKSKQLSKLNLEIKNLETLIKNLEEDLDNQAHGFEEDMEDLIRAKVKQEKRAILAEENLRKVKLQNAKTAGKLQEEFRKLSTEMSTTFEEKENTAMKAMDEANHLRVEKRHLEETVRKVKQEFDYLGDQYEEKIVDFLSQITLKSKHLEEMEKQIENLHHELKDQKGSYNSKIKNLECEKNDLENETKLVKIELENSKEDLRNVENDKNNETEKLHLEIERLKSRCNDMKRFFKEYELEKEQLKGDIKKKDQIINIMEKKINKINPRNNKPVPVNCSLKEVNNMKDRIKLLEGQIKVKETALECSEASFLEKEKDLQHKIGELEQQLEVLDQSIRIPQVSNEIELLNKNKLMEIELKEMQERYSEISLKFAEVEGERQQLVMTLRNVKNAKKC